MLIILLFFVPIWGAKFQERKKKNKLQSPRGFKKIIVTCEWLFWNWNTFGQFCVTAVTAVTNGVHSHLDHATSVPPHESPLEGPTLIHFKSEKEQICHKYEISKWQRTLLKWYWKTKTAIECVLCWSKGPFLTHEVCEKRFFLNIITNLRPKEV